MVDLICGHSVSDIVRETPLYISIFKNYASYKLFDSKSPMFGSGCVFLQYATESSHEIKCHFKLSYLPF
jgi:hypothetical protein